MRYPDSAAFLHAIAKRARKYYLGLTTITQDVEDFIGNEYGKSIVSNASIKFLMKQSSASIPVLAETFYLSEGERQLLVAADVGEGIFFAGQNHVALRVVASEDEHAVITTNPEEVLARNQQNSSVNPKQKVNQASTPPEQPVAPLLSNATATTVTTQAASSSMPAASQPQAQAAGYQPPTINDYKPPQNL
jgi:hypothetical protein